MRPYNGFSHDERMKAFRWFKEQPQRPMPYCHACGQAEGRIDAHSEDYSEPYGPHVGRFHLCYTCHMMVHCRFRNPVRWAEYVDMVARGAVFENSNGWGNFVRLFLRESPTPAGWTDQHDMLGWDDEFTVRGTLLRDIAAGKFKKNRERGFRHGGKRV